MDPGTCPFLPRSAGQTALPAVEAVRPHATSHLGRLSLRTLDPQLDLDRLFYTRLERVVRKDGTVRIDNELFEVNLVLRGLRVELELDPWLKDPVFVRYKGQDFGRARKVDRHLNSRLSSTEGQP